MGTPKSKTRLYKVWSEMKRRCNNPHDNVYKNYGGRGIKYAPEWEKFDNFHEWAVRNGYDPDKKRGECTLDRIDNEGNYSPDNCRWVSMKRQQSNKSTTVFAECDGEKKTLEEWSAISGIPRETIRKRITKYNYSPEEAIKEPLFSRRKKLIEHNGEYKTSKEWAACLGLSKNAVYNRIKEGWSIEDAITMPKQNGGTKR